MRISSHYRQIKLALSNAKYGLVLIGNNKKSGLEILSNFDSQNNLTNYLRLLKILHLFGENGATRKLCSEGYSQPELKGETDRLKKVLKYIQENYIRKLPMEEVAKQIHLSPSAFSHYFKKRTLKSFTQFVLELRLGKAAQLLQHTDMPIMSISYESGFQNLSHFNRSFNKKYNLSPLKFRVSRTSM